jgi:archaemetzincin
MLGLGGALVGAACLGRAALFRAGERESAKVTPQESGAEEEPALRTIREGGRAIRSLHRTKRPPQRGDWLDRHFEVGQTFQVYHRESPNRPTAGHTTLYIQPLGQSRPGQAQLLRATADLLGRWYGVSVTLLAPIGLEGVPEHARRISPAHGGVQVTTGYVLDLLRQRRPDDAVAVLGLTTVDLWPGRKGWRYVLGQASLVDRVGVWSLYRMGDPETEYGACLRRVLKTAVHETGHMLGIRHCIVFECGMNGSNHQDESDARPLWFCPEDEMKVWWACGIDPARRYDRLVAFAEAHELIAEARIWHASRAAILRTLATAGLP